MSEQHDPAEQQKYHKREQCGARGCILFHRHHLPLSFGYSVQHLFSIRVVSRVSIPCDGDYFFAVFVILTPFSVSRISTDISNRPRGTSGRM